MPFLFERLTEASNPDRTPASIANAFTAFVDSLRPTRDAEEAGIEPLLVRLRAHKGDRDLLIAAVARLIGQTKHVSLFADAGVLPPTGFIGELYRRIAHRLLPDVANPAYSRDIAAMLFHQRRDDQWLANVTNDQWTELITLLTPADVDTRQSIRTQLNAEVDNALQVLSIRLAALGLDDELLRVYPEMENYDSPFLVQQREIQDWLDQSKPLADGDVATETKDAMHALVLLDQCHEILDRVRRKTATTGTSFRLTYLMRRLTQTIRRIELLIAVRDANAEKQLISQGQLLADTLLAEAQRNDIREHITQSMDLIALRVTENAGRTGDHYITETRDEYFQMFRAALGAGFIVAFMAWSKVWIGGLHLPPLIEVFSICGMYASAFILMHVLHFSLATKQPAMTAAAIAASLDLSRDEKTSARIERLTDSIARVSRSQLAAIVGNVLLALPTAILLTYVFSWITGTHIVTPEKATKLVHDANLLTLAPMFAGIAGVVLFIGGLISGFFDNKASYSRIGERLGAHPLLNGLLGAPLTARFARYIENNLGALAGNAALGVMLGLVGPLGAALGLPLDVRHVTISTASLGLAIPVAYADISVGVAIALVFGIAAIGFFNLAVSFSLTLMLAFKARQVSVPERSRLLPTLWARFRANPREFLLPPPKPPEPAAQPGTHD